MVQMSRLPSGWLPLIDHAQDSRHRKRQFRATAIRSRLDKIKNPRPNQERRATCEHGTKASGRVVNNDYANDLTGVGE